MLTLGDPLRVVMTKWGGIPHWEFDARYLGEDQHGRWFGVPANTLMSRPGASFVSETAQVGLVPHPDAGGGGGWVATFHAPGYFVTTYVDMTCVPEWSDAQVHTVDLDLDVIRTCDGDVFVDDEDEFAEHQVVFGYPAPVVSLAEEACSFVLSCVLEERPPFDGDSSESWFARLADLRADLPRP